MSIKHTNETFIQKANLTHNNKYTYELVDYKHSKDKVSISCPVHGIFEQTPTNHLKGYGCSICGHEATTTKASTTKSEFATKASIVHNNLYSYELVEYKNSHTKVKIVCKEHGIFEQTPTSHLHGKSGCPICGNEASAKTQAAIAKSEFTTKANIIHNSKYTYELVEYRNCSTKVSIICKSHGSFEQTPNNHLKGRGCPHCASETSGFTRTKFKEKCIKNNNSKGILYILECFSDNETFIKIRNNQ